MVLYNNLHEHKSLTQSNTNIPLNRIFTLNFSCYITKSLLPAVIATMQLTTCKVSLEERFREMGRVKWFEVYPDIGYHFVESTSNRLEAEEEERRRRSRRRKRRTRTRMRRENKYDNEEPVPQLVAHPSRPSQLSSPPILL